jgi:hypothetical protein
MSNRTVTLGVRDFVNKYVTDQNIFSFLPEFSFIKPVAAKVKEKGCTCGLNQEIQRVTAIYNDFVDSVDVDLAQKVAVTFNLDKVCFGIQDAQGNYSVKCF